MERFLQRYQGIVGVLSGFDRILFRGVLRSIVHLKGMDMFLSSQHVLYKNFAGFVHKLSARIKEHAEALAKARGRPFLYLPSSTASKEERAMAIMERDGIKEGLVCILSCVEPCQTYALIKDRQAKQLRLIAAQRKCLHLYFYFVDANFGLMHVRLQSWLPLTIQVCLNGQQYLGRQLRKAGIGYEQRDNCFTRIDDLPKAQAVLDGLLTRPWAQFLNSLARHVNPWMRAKGLHFRDYYWTIRQGEFATDVLFRDQASLQAIYPRLVDHAIQRFSCHDVLRFLGRRVNRRFNGRVSSDIEQRPEGVRIKHWVEENSIKMYDKQRSVLRIETTMNNPRRFKVRRMVTRKGKRGLDWVPLRKGLADIRRRADICRAANARYLAALAIVGQPEPVAAILDPVSQRIICDHRPYRPLRPVTACESQLFRVLLRGEFAIQGFRNVDIRRIQDGDKHPEPQARRKSSGRISRWLRLLRAHALIRKVPKTYYYRVTEKGHRLMTLALKLRRTDLALLAA